MKQTLSKPLPRARSRKLVIQELEGETLVYDLQKHRAYCLNETASQIWQACDGRTTVAAIARQIAGNSNVRDVDVVCLGLHNLAQCGLLEERPAWLPEQGGVTRRDVLQAVGKSAAALLPAVAALAVPHAAQAATCPCPGIITGASCLGCIGCCGRNCTRKCSSSGSGSGGTCRRSC